MLSSSSGLRVHMTKMDVIANNIANVNTNDFQSSRVTMEYLKYNITNFSYGGYCSIVPIPKIFVKNNSHIFFESVLNIV